MMEFLAGIACIAFVGGVCYYMIGEEQKGEWKE